MLAYVDVHVWTMHMCTMCTSVYVYVFMCAYGSLHVCLHNVQVCVHECVCMCIKCVCSHMCECLCVCTYVRVCVWIYTCACAVCVYVCVNVVCVCTCVSMWRPKADAENYHSSITVCPFPWVRISQSKSSPVATVSSLAGQVVLRTLPLHF